MGREDVVKEFQASLAHWAGGDDYHNDPKLYMDYAERVVRETGLLALISAAQGPDSPTTEPSPERRCPFCQKMLEPGAAEFMEDYLRKKARMPPSPERLREWAEGIAPFLWARGSIAQFYGRAYQHLRAAALDIEEAQRVEAEADALERQEGENDG